MIFIHVDHREVDRAPTGQFCEWWCELVVSADLLHGSVAVCTRDRSDFCLL